MNLTIDLTPAEEARIAAAAKRTGLAPADLVKRLVNEHLPALTSDERSDTDAELRQLRQTEPPTANPEVTAQALFSQWAEEDAQLTDEEREQNERVYAQIEKNGIPRVQI